MRWTAIFENNAVTDACYTVTTAVLPVVFRVDGIARTPATGARFSVLRFSATDHYQLLDIFEYHIDIYICTYL